MKLILAVLLFKLFSNSCAQYASSVCSYEIDIDYSYSIDITYLYARAPQFCCTICSFQPNCVGNLNF